MSPFGSIAAVDLGRFSSNMVQPLVYEGSGGRTLFGWRMLAIQASCGIRLSIFIGLLFYQSLETLKTGRRLWMYTMHLLMGQGSKQFV